MARKSKKSPPAAALHTPAESVPSSPAVAPSTVPTPLTRTEVADILAAKRPFSDGDLHEIAHRAKRLSENAIALRRAEVPSDVRESADNVAEALFHLVEAFNPGGRFGDEPFPDLPLFPTRETNVRILLLRIRRAMQHIGSAVGYNPAVGYAIRYPDGRVYGPKIEQVADEHVYAFVQSIRTDDLVYGEPGASKYVDGLAAAADELLAKLAARRGAATATHDVLDAAETAILLVLNRHVGIVLTSEKIEGALQKMAREETGSALKLFQELSVRTINNRLPGLIKRGYVDRPRGDRGGCAITDMGKDRVNRLPSGQQPPPPPAPSVVG
jgi:hypothetical protein